VIPLGDNALEAERRRRNECRWRNTNGSAGRRRAKFGQGNASGKTPLLAAAPKYFLNLEARG